MCEKCGCGEKASGDQEHLHEHEHDHVHPHEHDRTHGDDSVHEGHRTTPRKITLEQRVLARNDEIAEENRAWLTARKVVALNLISAPGTGKTLLLERTLERLQGRIRCAIITGDQRTDNDACRLQGKGAIVRQIETHSACHLDAQMIKIVLPEVITDGVKLLFIENVGNLVCPAVYDLGESFKVALMSTTEGEDKPIKYPVLFMQAPVVVLTKIDLAPYLDWNIKLCREYLQRVHPGVFVFELSAKTGQGLDTWIEYLEKLLA